MKIKAPKKKPQVKAAEDTKFDPIKETEYTRFFTSKEHELAFYFKVNNPFFDLLLGIKRVHHVDAEKARELKNSYLRIFHPDRKIDSESGLDYDEICKDISATFERVLEGIKS